ncbi:MAG TPA: TIGR02147 family protein [Fibrobacteria bacterium]|mgnify:CR=1 FL=1|nr:TIGR02147 family protein [Fibrobacteria bacterium]
MADLPADTKLPVVFEYDDYHLFLRDWVAARRAKTAGYSFQSLANRAGLKSRSFLRLVSLGQKDLGSVTALALAEAMGLQGREGEFFQCLVAFNNATDLREKGLHLERMRKVGKPSRSTVLSVQQYDLLGKWFVAPIWELVTVVDFGDDFRKLASQLRPAITPAEARYAVELLLGLGLIERSGSLYVQKESSLRTRDDLKSQAVKVFQEETMGLGIEALDRFALDERNIGTLTLGLDGPSWRELRQKVKTFREELVDFAHRVKKTDRVYQINYQVFPLTKGPVDS